ncbi:MULTISPECIES: histidine phosphatase family protein [Amycolatopsis]|uniref:Histidine phosphatase family protein n=2 Tax=Amycolatopsis TaxID=1813 RepID=A0ABP8VR98_9PSEU|nr:histidine phosphatase family protein [Amycolatopsis sacchari]SFI95213.1 probable phosphoglycerate mutase [Amycolatopsis sacchari]
MADHLLYVARHGEAIDEGELSETGRRQAALLGRRLREVPLAAVSHSPLPRAVRTARLLAAELPGVPVVEAGELGDYPPPVPDELPPVYAEFVRQFSPAELASGARLAAAAIARFAVPTAEERHELVVTHNFLAAWFVCHALDAPPGRWLGLNQDNCALTVIRYRPDRPPSLLVFNDSGHLRR